MTKSSDKVSAKKPAKKWDRLKKKQDGDKFWANTLRRVLRAVTSIGGGGA